MNLKDVDYLLNKALGEVLCTNRMKYPNSNKIAEYVIELLKQERFQSPKLTDAIIEYYGFKPEHKGCHYEWFRIELEAKGFSLRWLESLKGYYIEPKFQPTARIEVRTEMDLKLAFELITGKEL